MIYVRGSDDFCCAFEAVAAHLLDFCSILFRQAQHLQHPVKYTEKTSHVRLEISKLPDVRKTVAKGNRRKKKSTAAFVLSNLHYKWILIHCRDSHDELQNFDMITFQKSYCNAEKRIYPSRWLFAWAKVTYASCIKGVQRKRWRESTKPDLRYSKD